ncbi:peptide/nickel transport system permease protein [Microbacterium sp. SORGH_AS428]|uniref:ABC transporter permease n=1 Tax=Microbacterium sp. SORGH_AS_0428 TaxID=3041788 RepID=UPI00285BFFEE|nr:ABC transporter permease [Microbacterium sp. SORGH_AS_0428]MDR6198200.1 peptide/nickel transport system permease protein [Microbacterium sp. SORGH_AS_0428]
MSIATSTNARAGAVRAFVWAWGAAGIAALIGLGVLIVAIVWPGLLAPGDPLAIAPAEALRPPSPSHLFGTDESGRDLYTRVVHGAAASAGVGAAATAIGVGVGLVLGFTAGLGPRWLDAALSRIIEVLFALPTLVMALLLVAVAGPGTTASVVAIGLATTPGYARMLRTQVRQVARSGYVEYARLEQAGAARIFLRHVAPNALWPLVSVATLGVGQAIVWVSALSFLGLGALPPSPEWGAMLNAGRVYIASAWWLTVFPGLAIVATAAVLTAVGRRLAGGVHA